jgi:hypothetical protein
MQATKEELLETMFSMLSVPRLYNRLWLPRLLHKDYYRRSSAEKKKSGRGSQGAWRQDELIGGKPPVVKW